MIKAHNGQQIAEAKAEDISRTIGSLIGLLGIKSTKETKADIDKQMLDMQAYIVRKYPDLTLAELRHAYDLYVSQELDIDVFRLFDAVDLGRVLKAYRKLRGGKLHAYIVSGELLLGPPVEKPGPSPRQFEIDMRYTLRKAIDVVRAGAEYDDWGNLVYDWLDGHKLVPFTHERKVEIYNQALDQLKRTAAGKKVRPGSTPDERKDAQKLVDVIKSAESGKEKLDVKVAEDARTIAKRIALQLLLRDWIDTDTNPDELLPPLPAITNKPEE